MPFATDTSLDLLGEIFGVPRLTVQTASVQVNDQNFEWFFPEWAATIRP
ncbi:MAG TPA: hypothetical protein VLW65_17970 [Bryobacteraceae bacterium]|nr:hypothetical protein [Bryobacteraceae bacterium]